MVVHPVSAGRQVRRRDMEVRFAIEQELNAVFFPDDAENVEVIGDLAAGGESCRGADAARAGVAGPMHGAVDAERSLPMFSMMSISPQAASLCRRNRRHHPERGHIPCRRNLHAGFNLAVGHAEPVLGLEARGGIDALRLASAMMTRWPAPSREAFSGAWCSAPSHDCPSRARPIRRPTKWVGGAPAGPSNSSCQMRRHFSWAATGAANTATKARRPKNRIPHYDLGGHAFSLPMPEGFDLRSRHLQVAHARFVDNERERFLC